MIESVRVPGSLVVEVEGRRLDARYLDTDGRIRDHFAFVRQAQSPGE